MRYRFSISLVLIVHVLLSFGILMALACTATPAPTPTQIVDEQTVELLEEMYWIHVDSIGKSLDVPEINRELEFHEAQAFVMDFLFNFYDDGLSEIESYGIEPFSTWPYCINAISGAVHQEDSI